MARLEQVGTIESSAGNSVGYSATISSDTFVNDKPLKDEDFLFYSTAPYSRKDSTIFQFGYGLNEIDPLDGSRHQYAHRISSENSVARFIPYTSPTGNPSANFLDRLTYRQTGSWSVRSREFDGLYNDYMYGGGESKGNYTNLIALATSWNYKEWCIVPVLVGIYVGTDLANGSRIKHGNVIALKDYFDNPNSYPQTMNNGTLAGFSYGFYFVGNQAHNTAGIGERAQMIDGGVEFLATPFECLVGGYAQDLLPPLPAYAYDVYTINNFRDGIKMPRCGHTLLGLAINFTSNFANSYRNLTSNIGLPFFTINNRGSGVYYGSGSSICFETVGNGRYLGYTRDEYAIGNVNDQSITSEIPVILEEYIDYDFLLKVASQIGMPIITERAIADIFMTTENLDGFYEEYGNRVKIPKFNPDTGEVKDDDPDNYGDIPETDPRKRVTEGTNPLEDVAEMDTSDPDTNQYTDTTPLNEPNLTAVGKFNKYYALSADDLEDLADFLYTNDSSVISDILDGLKLNGENPMNFLISLKMFPFDITDYAQVESGTITFGNGVDTEILAYKVNDFKVTIPLGECSFRKYFKNFYDYEPYTNAKIYIPYCGEVTVQTAQCVGHKIKVDLIVDIITGACCGVVFCDDIAIAYSEGNISAEIPITGENATQYVSQAMSALPQLINNGASFAGGNINSGLNLIKGAYDFTHMPTALEKSGSQTPTINFFKPQYCYFVVQSPVLLPTSAYASQVGYACEVTKKLSDLTGFTVCANVENITPPNATGDEIEMIKNLLETGVYI